MQQTTAVVRRPRASTADVLAMIDDALAPPSPFEVVGMLIVDVDDLDDDRPCPCGVSHTASEHGYSGEDEL